LHEGIASAYLEGTKDEKKVPPALTNKKNRKLLMVGAIESRAGALKNLSPTPVVLNICDFPRWRDAFEAAGETFPALPPLLNTPVSGSKRPLEGASSDAGSSHRIAGFFGGN
jgi:hypothetical protein